MKRPKKLRPASLTEGHPPPRYNVLLLTCMDVRLIDGIGTFMRHDNLTNRYDHLILAGSSLGVIQTTFPSWRETFFQHLELALELRQPHDVYIIEHRNCGAYRKFLGTDFGDSPEEQDREARAHAEKAFELADAIHAYMAERKPVPGQPTSLKVHCFLMDLRGQMVLLTREGPALGAE